jgi:hypothetical protein
MLLRARVSRIVPIGLLLAAGACGGNDATGPVNDVLLRWTFGSDLEGWSDATTSSGGWGTVDLSNNDSQNDAPDDEDGSVKLDGVGGPGEPNAWIFRSVVLPANAATLSWWAAGHDRDGGDAELRVRLVDGNGASHTLADWEEFTGSAGTHHWELRSAAIAAYAGQTVTLYFEQNDNGPGSHEQIYLDEIKVLRN